VSRVSLIKARHLLFPFQWIKIMKKDRNHKYSLLIVDDEPLIRQSLYEIFRIEGYQADMAQSGEEALEKIEANKFDIILTDLKLPQMSGIDLLVKSKELSPETEVILITGYGTIESAVDAMKRGAYEYITKPINDDEVKLLIDTIIEKKEIIEENRTINKLESE